MNWYINKLGRFYQRKIELEDDLDFYDVIERHYNKQNQGVSHSGKTDPALKLAGGSNYVTITAVEARNLVSKDLDGTSDPYCQINVDNKWNQTAYCPNTLNPIWKETF